MHAHRIHVSMVLHVYQMDLVDLRANALLDSVVNGVKIKMVALVNHVKMKVFVLAQVVVHIHVNVLRAMKDKLANKVHRSKVHCMTFHFLILVDICGVKNPCICGTCQNDPTSPQGFRCFCPPGYSGNRCDKCN